MDANATLLKVTQLLTLAGNEGASAEEARTAAFLAAKLIKTHGLVVVAKSAPAPKTPPAPKYQGHAYQKPPAATPYKVVISKVFCACGKCGKTIKPGEKVSVKVGNLMTMKGARHASCV